MFIRKKKNRSGTTSVVVVDKTKSAFKELINIGVSHNDTDIEKLYRKGKKWIDSQLGLRDIFEETAK